MTAAGSEDRIFMLRGIMMVLLATLMFAFMDGINKSLVADYSTVQILWVRYVFFLAFALLIARRRGLRIVFQTRHLGLQLGRSFVLVAEKAAFVIAWSYLSLADTHAIGAISPLLVTVFAGLLLKERVGLPRALAAATGFAGVLLIIRPGVGTISTAAAIPLTAAALFAAYQLLTRAVSRDDEADTSLLYSGLVGALVLSVIGPFDWRPPTPVDWGLLLIVALIGSGAHFALIKALQFAPASALQPFSYSLFLWAVLVGFVGFDDLPDLWTVAGGIVVIASGLYIIRHEHVREVAVAAADAESSVAEARLEDPD